MQDLQRALDDSNIIMTEAVIPECLHAYMDERLAVLGMDHQMNTKKASLFRRKSDITGLVRASDSLRSKASGDEITTRTGDIDCLLFWKNATISINFEGERDYHTWLRIFRSDSNRSCCVCRAKSTRDHHTNCNVCQAICCIQCDRAIESGACPVCRFPGKFVLSRYSGSPCAPPPSN